MSHSWVYKFFFWTDGCNHIVVSYSWSLLFRWLRPYRWSLQMIPFIWMATSIPQIMYHYMSIPILLGMIIIDFKYVYVYFLFSSLLTMLLSSLHWLVKHLAITPYFAFMIYGEYVTHYFFMYHVHFLCHILECQNIKYCEKYPSWYIDQNLLEKSNESCPKIILEKVS